MARLKTKEIVVRMLVNHGIGNWMYGYELQGKATPWGFSGVDADTRAHELARQGYFDSPTYRYIVGHRRVGKYAQFRIESKGPLGAPVPVVPKKEYDMADSIKWFDQLPDKPEGWVPSEEVTVGVGQSANRFPKGMLGN